MKKTVLGLSLSLATLAFLIVPARAAASPATAAPVPSLSDQAFLASLAGAPAPEPAAKRPAIAPKATCVANCWNGGTVQCMAPSCTAVNGSCPGEPGHVTCGTTVVTCPTPCPGCPPSWCTEDCDALCPCGGSLFCSAGPFCTSHCQCKLHCPE